MEVGVLEMEGFTWDVGRDRGGRKGLAKDPNTESVGTHHKGTCYFAW